MATGKKKTLRVLAVDDESPMLELYRDSLMSRTGDNFFFEIEYDACQTGKSAVDTVEKAVKAGRPYAVIFLDLNLGTGMDGVTAGACIRELDSNVNFVIVTGTTGANPLDIGVRIPPLDKLLYIHKPFHIMEIRQFTAALGTKWESERLLTKAHRDLQQKIRELQMSETSLKEHKMELEDINRQLIETNSALSILARNLEKARKVSERQLLHSSRTLILPIIDRLRQSRYLRGHQTDLDLLSSYIKDLNPGLADEMGISRSLSATESRIATMVKVGMTSHDIARNLYISTETVKTHRKNIRRKLKLQGSGINLQSYLESHNG
ncbi:MAG: response regulator [Desulfobacterales bacterium]|nr:response regulator [Desulfobacterales bacterium]